MNGETISEIVDYVLGSAVTDQDIVSWAETTLGVIIEDPVDFMLELNIERCPSCGYWVDSQDLLDEDQEVVECSNCRS